MKFMNSKLPEPQIMCQKKSRLQDSIKRSLAISVGANKVFDIRADIAC